MKTFYYVTTDLHVKEFTLNDCHPHANANEFFEEAEHDRRNLNPKEQRNRHIAETRRSITLKEEQINDLRLELERDRKHLEKLEQ